MGLQVPGSVGIRGLGFRVSVSGFGDYPKAPKRVLGFLGEGFGFGG